MPPCIQLTPGRFESLFASAGATACRRGSEPAPTGTSRQRVSYPEQTTASWWFHRSRGRRSPRARSRPRDTPTRSRGAHRIAQREADVGPRRRGGKTVQVSSAAAIANATTSGCAIFEQSAATAQRGIRPSASSESWVAQIAAARAQQEREAEKCVDYGASRGIQTASRRQGASTRGGAVLGHHPRRARSCRWCAAIQDRRTFRQS